MKTFLRNMAYISLGVILSVVTAAILPQTIKAVTAQLSTTRVMPLQDMRAYINQSPKYEKLKTTPVSYALPAININQNNGQPIQTDMNGDGLSDIVYATTTNVSDAGGLLVGTQYVLLNTGSGFEIAYFCQKDFRYVPNVYPYQVDQIFYRGHCADTNFPSPKSPHYAN
jgi:hypothetical protein